MKYVTAPTWRSSINEFTRASGNQDLSDTEVTITLLVFINIKTVFEKIVGGRRRLRGQYAPVRRKKCRPI